MMIHILAILSESPLSNHLPAARDTCYDYKIESLRINYDQIQNRMALPCSLFPGTVIIFDKSSNISNYINTNTPIKFSIHSIVFQCYSLYRVNKKN